MTQTVIAIFDTPDTAYSVEETLMNDQGIDESSFHITSQQGTSSQQGQSMDEIRNFLSELFGPEGSGQVDYYAQQIQQGGALLSVDLSDDIDIEPIRETMQEAGATDMNARRAEEGQEGQTLSVMEEQMEVGKQEVGKGNVQVSSRMVETPVQEEVNLKEEHATISRRPVDQPIDPDEVSDLGERTIEVEEMAERPVVSKSARIVEEVEVGKESSEKTQTVQDTVRHTEVDVKRAPAGSSKKGKK